MGAYYLAVDFGASSGRLILAHMESGKLVLEEVHRFAIGYHRQKRKRVLGSTLTGIDGVGEKRAALLLRHFGSVSAVRSATVEQLAAVKGMTRPAAEAVVRFFEEEK